MESFAMLNENDMFRIFGREGVNEGTIIKFRNKHEAKYSVGVQRTIVPCNSGTSQNVMDVVEHQEESDGQGFLLKKNLDFTIQLDVESVLKKNITGRHWLLKRDAPPSITQPISVSKIIVDEFYNNQVSMGIHEFELVAKKIVAVFKNDDIQSYYIAPEETATKKKSRGCLADVYYNKSKGFIKNQIIRRKTQPKCKTVSAPAASKDCNAQINFIEFLKYHMSPEEEVLFKWKESMALRREIDQNCSLYEIFRKYVFLASERGFKLVVLYLLYFKSFSIMRIFSGYDGIPNSIP
jgi:hypothetical protein